MDKDIEKLLKSIEKQESSAFKISIFYIISILLLLTIWGLMIPSSEALYKAKGAKSLIPLFLLTILWLYIFFTSRKKILQDKIVSAYGWIVGITSLVIVLMLYYLQTTLKG